MPNGEPPPPPPSKEMWDALLRLAFAVLVIGSLVIVSWLLGSLL